MKKLAFVLCLLAVVVISGCATDNSGASSGQQDSGSSHSGCH